MNERLIDRYNRRWRRRLLFIEIRATLMALGLLFAEVYAALTFAEHPAASCIIFALVSCGALVLDE